MVEVPEVADGQQKDTDISGKRARVSDPLVSTSMAFDGYRIRINKILLRDQLTTGRQQGISQRRTISFHPNRIDPCERYILHSAGMVIR